MKFIHSLIALLLVVNVEADDRLRMRAVAESGPYFHSSGSGQALAGLSAAIDYRKSLTSSALGLKCRLTPKYYLSDRLVNIRLTSAVNYQRQFNAGRLDLRLGFKNNRYEGNTVSSFSYDLYQTHAAFTHPVSKDTRFALEAGFYSRDFSGDYFNRMSGYSARFLTLFDLFQKFRMGAGFYAERFHISSEINEQTPNDNNGLRYGPEFSIGLRSTYIMSITFLYSRQNYDRFVPMDTNYHLIMLLGRYISSNTTLFLFVNLYRGTSSGDIPLNLRYKPISDENYYYLKIGHDLRPHCEIFLKFGYQKEELFIRNGSLSGTKLMAGCTLSR